MSEKVLKQIAEYVASYHEPSDEAMGTARLCLADALGCAIAALEFDECKKLLGPIVKGTVVPHGTRVIGTKHVLDPILGAFNLGSMIRWLDYNDTFLAKEWAHPSDNLGGIIALMDHLSQKGQAFTVRDLLLAMIKAYEIQGSLAISNSFNQVGFDHVILVKVATAAVTTKLLGGTEEHIYNALSQAFIDVGPLRTYRHAPNTGMRKSWAAGDATSRGLFLAWLTMLGEKGYETPLSAPKWGLQDVILKGSPLLLESPLGSTIMENILLKVSFPAEFHAQTAVEAAISLHRQVKNRWSEIDEIHIHTHEAALRIIDKKGPLKNHADRDHCMQYMVAIALLHGHLSAEHYSDTIATNPKIDELREKMVLFDEKKYSEDYLNPELRSIANSLTIHMKSGERLGPLAVHYPLGHKKRRKESQDPLFEKFRENLSKAYPKDKIETLTKLFQTPSELDTLPFSRFINLLL